MSNHRFKWVAGVAAALTLLASAFIPQPAAAAPQKINLKEKLQAAAKVRTVQMMKLNEQRRKKLGITSRHGVTGGKASVQSTVTSVTYSGKMGPYTLHHYEFTTTADAVVHIGGTASGGLQYYLMSGTSFDQPKYYWDNDVLPAGFYVFEVVNYENVPADYSFQISGVPFMGTPDQTVPNLTFTSPKMREGRLPVNTASLTFTGTHDAHEAGLYVNWENFTVLPQTFSKSVPVKYGPVYLEAAAYELSGNYTVEWFNLVAPGVKRIDGASRYYVSANVSKTMYPDGAGSTVIIARGDLFTDALSGGSLAGLEGAPILLSDYRTQSLLPPVLDEIKRLKTQKAIILGGVDSVGTNVVNQLKSIGVTDIQRIDGPNRFAVSANIAYRVVDTLKKYDIDQDTAIVASGLKFPDALAASSPSAQGLMPILQSSQDQLPAEVEAFIKNRPAMKYFIMVGGADTVSDNVRAKLESYARARGGAVVRIDGRNRYEVSANIARFFEVEPTFHIVAKGTDFPDALSGAPLSSYLYYFGYNPDSFQAPILLTPPTYLEPSVEAYLNEAEQLSGMDRVAMYILGGTDSVSVDIENKLKAMVQ